jgi:hypothetical protein
MSRFTLNDKDLCATACDAEEGVIEVDGDVIEMRVGHEIACIAHTHKLLHDGRDRLATRQIATRL